MDGPLNSKYSSSAADIVRTSPYIPVLTGQTHLILKCILLNGVVNYILTFTALKVQAHMVFTVLRVFITPYYHLARAFLEQGFSTLYILTACCSVLAQWAACYNPDDVSR